MNVLVFGKTGQLSQELGMFKQTMCLDRSSVDLLVPEKCSSLIRDLKPDAVINAAAYTAVDRAELEEPLATATNARAPEAMAIACRDLNIPFLHISSDYVFDGDLDRPFNTLDETNPLGAYGRSKLLGEKAVMDSWQKAIILRTSWVFSSYGQNFVKTMLHLSKEKDHLRIVADQFGGPTSAKSIASACIQILNKYQVGTGPYGIFHFCGSPYVNWADFAKEIFDIAGISMNIERISNAEYSQSAQRPRNSRLDCAKIKEMFNINMPDWREDLKLVISQLEGLER